MTKKGERPQNPLDVVRRNRPLAPPGPPARPKQRLALIDAQVAVPILSPLLALVCGGLLVWLAGVSLTEESMREIASICVNLLVVSAVGGGSLLVLNVRSRSSRSTIRADELQPSGAKKVTSSQREFIVQTRLAGAAVAFSLVLVCVAIPVGVLAPASSGWEFLCVSGLLAGLLVLFVPPLSLVMSRRIGAKWLFGPTS